MYKPTSSEYSPYFQPYIDLVESEEFSELLIDNKLEVTTFFKNIPEDRHDYKYAEDKWTIKETLMHIIDTERVFSYRALACARGETALLPTMDEKLYTKNSGASNRTLKSLIKEFEIVRENSIVLFEHMTEQCKTLGTTANQQPISARALGYLIIGHARHHLNVIRERYL
jgi:hypothetical protein